MTTFINQRLGLIMIDSLWQGLIIGIALAIILIFLRKPTVRYIVACIALTFMLILPIVSHIELPTVSLNNFTPPTTETITLNQPTNPIPASQATPTPSPLITPSAFTFINTFTTSQKLRVLLTLAQYFLDGRRADIILASAYQSLSHRALSQTSGSGCTRMDTTKTTNPFAKIKS